MYSNCEIMRNEMKWNKITLCKAQHSYCPMPIINECDCSSMPRLSNNNNNLVLKTLPYCDFIIFIIYSKNIRQYLQKRKYFLSFDLGV